MIKFVFILFFINSVACSSLLKERNESPSTSEQKKVNKNNTSTPEKHTKPNCEKLSKMSIKKDDEYRIHLESISKEEFQKYLKAGDTGYHYHFSALSLRKRIKFQKIEEVYKQEPTQKNRMSYLKARAEMLRANHLSGRSLVKDIPVLKKAMNESITSDIKYWCLCKMTKEERKHIDYCHLAQN